MTKTSLLMAALCALTIGTIRSQSVNEPYYFTTLAGSALNPGAQDNTGTQAQFNQPWGLAVDGAHNVYVADLLNQVIRKITPGGVVTTVAGVAGSAGFNNGAAGTALFSRPTDVAVNAAGTVIYVADCNNQVIRQISGGVVGTLAGSVGAFGTTDAMGTSAQFYNPFGVALNSAGTILYVADMNNQTIRAITLSSGAVTTLAGAAGVVGSTDDPANDLNARFNTPRGITVDASGNVYVGDAGNSTVRKIAAGGGVSTLAGSAGNGGFTDGAGTVARFSQLFSLSPFGGPSGLAVDGAGNVYVADQRNHLIRKITTSGSVTTLAGLAQTSGSADGPGEVARFNFPAGVAVDDAGTLYVADTANDTIRVGTNAVLNFGGLDHLSVGNATLNMTDSGLSVTNLGTNGQDGVQIKLGSPSDFALNVYYQAPQGTGTVTLSSFGYINGQAEQPVGTATVGFDGTNEAFAFDFSKIGANTYTLLIFNGSSLVYESEGNSGPGFLRDVITLTPLPSEDWHLGYYYGDNLESYHPSWMTMTSAALVAHKVGGGAGGLQTVMGDRVVVIPENPTNVVTAVSSGRIQAQGIPEFKILTESVSDGSSAFTAVGSTKFMPQGDRLPLVNLGVSGNDGVSVVNPNSSAEPPSLTLDWCGEPGCGVYPCMCIASMDVSANFGWFGTLAGTPNSKIASVHITNWDENGDGTPDAVNLQTDYSPVGNPTVRIEFWRYGNLVAATNGQPANPSLIVSSPPTEIQFDGLTAEYNWDPSSPAIFDRWGNLIYFDSIHVIPENPSAASLGGPWNVQILTAKIPALTLINARIIPQCVAAPTNMVLWLPFDETSGTNSANRVPLGNNGLRVNNPMAVAGDFVGNSLSFSGVDGNEQYVTVPSYNAINFDTNDLSIDAWVRRDSSSGTFPRIIVDKRSLLNQIGYSLSVSYGNLLFQLCDSAYLYTNYRDTGIIPADDEWHFIAVTVDRSATNGGRFYVDGNPTGTFNPTDHPGSINNTDDFVVGYAPFGGASSWRGGIDEVEMFNRVLTPLEVSALYNAGSAGKCKITPGTLPLITCATNKTVPCGTAWSFDPPTLLSGCDGTNKIALIVISTVTNGISPQIMTRTWMATDECSNSTTCSQTVTVSCATNGPGNCTNFVVNGSFEITSPVLAPNSFDNTLNATTGVPGWTTAATNSLEVWCDTVGGIPATDGTNQLEINAQSADETVSQTVTGLSTTCPVTFCFDYTGRFGSAANGAGPSMPNNDFTVSITGKDFAFSVPLNPVAYVTGGWLRFCTNFVPPDASFTIAFHGQPHYSDGTIYTQGGSHIDNVSLTQCCSSNGCTAPPIIHCPTNTIVVALNKDCMLEIPTLKPSAADACTPGGQLTYLQDPPAGTVVAGPSRTVTLVVQDARGNASQCQVQVYGQDKTPPTLIYPKAVPLTNCVVPNVLALVFASDPCTPTNKLIFTQSPSAGTPISPGVNQVSVTVTDPSGNATTQIIPLTSSGPQSFLNVLFNTGVNASRLILPNGSVDPHYTLGSVPSGTPTGSGNYNAPNALVGPVGFGSPSSPAASAWITPSGNWNKFPDGFYTFSNQFVLPAGTDPLTASISGRWTASTGGKIYVNGSAMPVSSIPTPPWGSFWPYWAYFTINSGFLGYPAVNTIVYVSESTEDYPGVRVEFTDASISCGTCTPPTILQATLNQSRPLNSTVAFNATVGGTPPFIIVWYHNGQQVVDGGHYSGAATATLTVTPLSYADAGTYTANVYGPCGKAASAPAKLTVTQGWGPWPWAWWNFHDRQNPLMATVGPDLILNGTNIFGISSGSTFDFGLPNIGGQSANVLDIPAMLPAGTFIQLPAVGPLDGSYVSNYTLIADCYMPSNSSTRAMLMSIFDRWGNLFVTATPSGTLNLSGMVGDMAINQDYSMTLMPNAWNRVALVVETTSATAGSNQVDFLACCNGKHINTDHFYENTSPSGSNTVFTATVGTSADNGTNGEVYLSSVQFHATAFTPEMLAGLGSPDSSPLTANDTSVGTMPMMSAKMSGGMVNFIWSGGAFLLQETTDLSNGTWLESNLPFDEQADLSGKVMTTAHADPTMEGPTKYYRLIYKP